MDKTIEDIITRLTSDRKKQDKLKNLLQRLVSDGWITPNPEGGYDWRKDVKLATVAWWVIFVERTVGVSSESKIRWKPFEKLFNLKNHSLKRYKVLISYNADTRILSYFQEEEIPERGDKYDLEDLCKDLFTISSDEASKEESEYLDKLTKTYWGRNLKDEYGGIDYFEELRLKESYPRVKANLSKRNKYFAIEESFRKLIEGGFILPLSNGGYKWVDSISLTLIAYWVEQINNLIIRPELNNKRTIWKPFERIFGLKKNSLRTAKANWLNIHRGKKFKPNGYKAIDAIFISSIYINYV